MSSIPSIEKPQHQNDLGETSSSNVRRAGVSVGNVATATDCTDVEAQRRQTDDDDDRTIDSSSVVSGEEPIGEDAKDPTSKLSLITLLVVLVLGIALGLGLGCTLGGRREQQPPQHHLATTEPPTTIVPPKQHIRETLVPSVTRPPISTVPSSDTKPNTTTNSPEEEESDPTPLPDPFQDTPKTKPNDVARPTNMTIDTEGCFPPLHPGNGEMIRFPCLVGMDGEEARATLEGAYPNILEVYLLEEHSRVTMDLRFDRVRIYVDTNGIVTRAPCIG